VVSHLRLSEGLHGHVEVRALVFEYSNRDFFEAQTEVGVERVVASSCWLGNPLLLSTQTVISLSLKNTMVLKVVVVDALFWLYGGRLH